MKQQDPQSLIKMAEEISRNIPDRANLAQAVSNHIQRFWAPSLINTLQDYVAKHPQEVSDNVRAALKKLAQSTAEAHTEKEKIT